MKYSRAGRASIVARNRLNWVRRLLRTRRPSTVRHAPARANPSQSPTTGGNRWVIGAGKTMCSHTTVRSASSSSGPSPPAFNFLVAPVLGAQLQEPSEQEHLVAVGQQREEVLRVVAQRRHGVWRHRIGAADNRRHGPYGLRRHGGGLAKPRRLACQRRKVRKAHVVDPALGVEQAVQRKLVEHDEHNGRRALQLRRADAGGRRRRGNR